MHHGTADVPLGAMLRDELRQGIFFLISSSKAVDREIDSTSSETFDINVNV